MSFLRVQACPSNDHAITNRVFVADADYQKLRRASDDARARRAEPRAQGLVAFAAALLLLSCDGLFRRSLKGFAIHFKEARSHHGRQLTNGSLVAGSNVFELLYLLLLNIKHKKTGKFRLVGTLHFRL